MQLQSARAGFDDLLQRYCPGIVTLSSETKVQGQPVGSSKHVPHIELTWRARRGIRSRAWPSSPSDHSGGTGSEGLVDLLRADVVDVDVESTGGDDEFLARDDFGGGADGERGMDSGHDVWVSSFSYANDVTTLDTDICL